MLHLMLQPMPVSIGFPSSLLQGSYTLSLGGFKLNIFIFVSSQVLSLHHIRHCKHVHYFSVTCDDQINACGLKFSMACEWHILIEEDKDNLLQFAKVFPTKFLNLPIHQSFILAPFCTVQYYCYKYTIYDDNTRKSHVT